MYQRFLLALTIACAVCLVSTARAADEVAQEQTFHLENIDTKDALTIIRSIADAKISDVGEHTFVARGTPENLALVSAVVRMADTAGDTVDESPLPAGDGTVITVVVLRHASAIDVLRTLRKEVRVARIATLGEARIFLRGTEEQIQAAMEVIRRLEGAGHD